MKRSASIDTIQRRTFMTGGAACGVLATQNHPAFANSFASLHTEVAAHVRKLVQGMPTALNLLAPTGADGNLMPVISAFKDMTGVDVKLSLSPVDDISADLMLGAMSGDQTFDLALPATFALPDLVAAQVLLPITDYARHYEPAGFREGSLFTVGDSFDGKTYGFQADGDAYMMFYNNTMLQDSTYKSAYEDRFGTPLDVPLTWPELDRQMEFFHRPDQGTYGGLLFRTPGYLAWDWWVRFHAKGVWPLSKDMEPQINGDAGLEALEEMIRATQFLHPEASYNSLFENWERYSRGDIYCNIGWGGTQKYLNGPTSAMRGKLAYGKMPGGIVNNQLLTTPYFNWGWSYVVTNDSTQPELAYLFALFAASPEMSTLAVRQADGFFDPIRLEHYDDPGIIDAYSPEFLKVHRESLTTAIPDLYLMKQGEYFRILGRELAKALNHEKSPQAALDRVAQHWRLITKSAGNSLQRARWRRLRSKYPDHARALLRDL